MRRRLARGGGPRDGTPGGTGCPLWAVSRLLQGRRRPELVDGGRSHPAHEGAQVLLRFGHESLEGLELPHHLPRQMRRPRPDPADTVEDADQLACQGVVQLAHDVAPLVLVGFHELPEELA